MSKKYTRIKHYLEFIQLLKTSRRYGLKTAKSYEVIFNWLRTKLSHSQFLILSGILVGFTAGLAGVILKLLVHYIHFIITNKVHFSRQLIFYGLFPVMGITLTALIVKYFFKGQDRKGVPAILYEIARNSSFVSHVKMYSQVIQSAVTVGLGGSAGLESPIAVTGAAIGSNFAQTYKLSYKDRTLLLASGAAAGIAAAFNAPIAGVMFAFEILLTGVIFTDFIPLVVAAVCGSLLSRIILNEEVLFKFSSRQGFNYHNIPYYLVLGFFCGLYARYFILISQRVEHYFHQLQFSKVNKAIAGGLVLSVLCMLFPPLFGEGYESIKSFTNGDINEVIRHSFFGYLNYGEWVIILFLALVCLLKAFATSITIYAGGNGGNFAPALFAGGTMGYLFAITCTQLGFADVPVTNLIIVGMGGMVGGVLYAPLTAIFLIAEASSGYDLFIPLMIVCVISFLMAKWFSTISPDLKQLAAEGKIFTTEHDKNLLLLINTGNVIEKNTPALGLNSSFNDLLDIVKKGNRNIIAILDEKHLAGIIYIDDIMPLMFNPQLHEKFQILNVMKPPVSIINHNEDMIAIINKFDETGTWVLPVVDDDNYFIGFISKSVVLNRYRQVLKEHSDL
ncbi:chloride channel protein [Mucilaginibacter sp. 14171R-50]|uniref:chloride channel protein n=1 Tax=Mucilaginibacter sp. 14171R-50 TaxID=2703789 RepID=UPI00138C190C|nr:chloride channel protein [Mucilaginibacter sp. 14171R-50]QHS57395.1 chloride channel protein [Mucilaginibacter sp. 14171R-50]